MDQTLIPGENPNTYEVQFTYRVDIVADSVEDLRKKIMDYPASHWAETASPCFTEEDDLEIIGYDEVTREPIFDTDEYAVGEEGEMVLKRNVDPEDWKNGGEDAEKGI